MDNNFNEEKWGQILNKMQLFTRDFGDVGERLTFELKSNRGRVIGDVRAESA